MFRQIAVHIHVQHTHTWVARDGRVFVFSVIRILVDGKPTRHAFTFLLSEDDEP